VKSGYKKPKITQASCSADLIATSHRQATSSSSLPPSSVHLSTNHAQSPSTTSVYQMSANQSRTNFLHQHSSLPSVSFGFQSSSHAHSSPSLAYQPMTNSTYKSTNIHHSSLDQPATTSHNRIASGDDTRFSELQSHIDPHYRRLVWHL